MWSVLLDDVVGAAAAFKSYCIESSSLNNREDLDDWLMVCENKKSEGASERDGENVCMCFRESVHVF